MGYRSDWKIAISGKKERVAAMLQWLVKTSELLGTSEEYNRTGWFEYFRDCTKKSHKCHLSEDGRLLILQDEQVKCYDGWGETVKEIINYGRNELRVHVAYVRLGEDDNDIDSDNDGELYIPINRSIGEVYGEIAEE